VELIVYCVDKMKTNFKAFLKKYEANQQKVLEASEKIINATVLEMYKSIIDRTPVGNPSLWKYPAPKDYNPGTLRNSWQISFSKTLRNTQGQFASAGQISNSGGVSLKINSDNSNVGVMIYNNQPYAQRVETGWSTQAPSGMMRITVAEYTSLINGNTARYRIK
jgi:hypothetical protein